MGLGPGKFEDSDMDLGLGHGHGHLDLVESGLEIGFRTKPLQSLRLCNTSAER